MARAQQVLSYRLNYIMRSKSYALMDLVTSIQAS
ncbi:Uncharacterised protein [Vibrio cholerae]|nr:Uncharacterised protein [Vibrio cholerae]CSI41208.1 Uncharacterised protein [Vibrio cholerae]